MSNTEPVLVGTRKSHWFYGDAVNDPLLSKLLSTEKFPNGFYEHMLSDDLRDLLPYGRGVDRGFKVIFDGPDVVRARTLVERGLSPHDRYATINQSLRSFVVQAAQLVVLSSNPNYEIDYLFQEGNDATKPESFLVHLIPLGSVGHLRGRPVQYVPKGVSESTTRRGLGYIKLDSSQIFTITLPKSLEKRTRSAIRFLGVASTARMKEFALSKDQMMGKGDFDFSEYNKLLSRLFYKGTRQLGWTSREIFDKHTLHPYVLWRYLEFKEFKIEVRDTIINQLNQVLEVVGRALDVECRFRIEGVIQRSDVLQAKSELTKGSRSLRDLGSL